HTRGLRRHSRSTLFPYTTLFRSRAELEAFELRELREVRRAGVGEPGVGEADVFEIGQVVAEQLQTFVVDAAAPMTDPGELGEAVDRKSTRLNSSHQIISYAVFCL